MKTKYVQSWRGLLLSLVAASALQGYALSSSAAEPLSHATTTASTDALSEPKPQSYLLEFRAGFFPNLGAHTTYDIGDGTPRLEVRALLLDGEEAAGLSAQYTNAHGSYPRVLVPSTRPLQKELFADVVEADGARFRFKLNIGQVIQPAEYLEGGRMVVIVRPGTIVVQTATHEKCRIGTRSDWCRSGLDAAHVWERVPGKDPRYVGKIGYHASQTMQPADYAVLLANNPPSAEVEIAVSPANPPGPQRGARCLKDTDFSLALNRQPVSLRLVPPLVGATGHQCARYTLPQPIKSGDSVQLTVRQNQQERSYLGLLPELNVSSPGAGVTFYVPLEDHADVQIAQTQRFLRSSKAGVTAWRADLPWEPQLGRAIGQMQWTGTRVLP